MTSVLTTMAVGAVSLGVALGVATPAGFSGLDRAAEADRTAMITAVDRIPVTFAMSPPSLSGAELCDAAMIDVAIGAPVPARAAPCLRAVMLEAAAGGPVMAMPTPETCEALLPALAVGVPVTLGVGVPCVETYVLTQGEQMAQR